MPKFSQIRPLAIIRILSKHGFVKARQKGSHLIMVNEATNKQVVVVMHSRPLKKGTINAIFKQAGIDKSKL